MKTPFVEGKYADDIEPIAAAVKTDYFLQPCSCFMLSIKPSALQYPIHTTRRTKPVSQLTTGHDTAG